MKKVSLPEHASEYYAFEVWRDGIFNELIDAIIKIFWWYLGIERICEKKKKRRRETPSQWKKKKDADFL